jgi:hypothetical protein
MKLLSLIEKRMQLKLNQVKNRKPLRKFIVKVDNVIYVDFSQVRNLNDNKKV